jgi:hypothetical protein
MGKQIEKNKKKWRENEKMARKCWHGVKETRELAAISHRGYRKRLLSLA